MRPYNPADVVNGPIETSFEILAYCLLRLFAIAVVVFLADSSKAH